MPMIFVPSTSCSLLSWNALLLLFIAQTILYLESPILHLNLLLFALQTNLTTAVCIVEYQSWPELSAAQKLALGGLYIPYFVFGELADPKK